MTCSWIDLYHRALLRPPRGACLPQARKAINAARTGKLRLRQRSLEVKLRRREEGDGGSSPADFPKLRTAAGTGGAAPTARQILLPALARFFPVPQYLL